MGQRNATADKPQPAKPRALLSIAGGGIKVFYYFAVIRQIANRITADTGRKVDIASCFSIIGGTSCGSILASLFATNRYSLSKIAQILEESKHVFDVQRIQKYSALIRRGHMYSQDALRQIVDKHMRETTIQDLQTNVYMPTVRAKASPQIYAFTNRQDPATLVTDAVMASCAAPLYFGPYEAQGDVFFDGGTWLNSPAMGVLQEWESLFAKEDNRPVVCLAIEPLPYKYGSAADAGAAAVSDALNIVFRTQNEFAQVQVADLIQRHKGRVRLITTDLENPELLDALGKETRALLESAKSIQLDDFTKTDLLTELGERVGNIVYDREREFFLQL